MESKLQKKIITDLKRKGWIPLKVVLSNLPGFPDISAYRDKQTIFLEVKDKKKKAEPLQLFWHRKLRKQGFKVFVIDTWELYLELRPEFSSYVSG